MSWFYFGDITTANKKIGVWLRPDSNKDLLRQIKNTKELVFLSSVSRIVVKEFDENDKNFVYLEVFSKSLLDSIRGKTRYSYFVLRTEIDNEWVCEGDLGKGAKF